MTLTSSMMIVFVSIGHGMTVWNHWTITRGNSQNLGWLHQCHWVGWNVHYFNRLETWMKDVFKCVGNSMIYCAIHRGNPIKSLYIFFFLSKRKGKLAKALYCQPNHEQTHTLTHRKWRLCWLSFSVLSRVLPWFLDFKPGKFRFIAIIFANWTTSKYTISNNKKMLPIAYRDIRWLI